MSAHRRRLPLSDAPPGSHLGPYTASAGPRRRLPQVGEEIEVSDGKPVPGFQVKTSTGPLWLPLARAQAPTMRVVALRRRQEFEGVRGVTVAECAIAEALDGEPWSVWAYFKGGRRIA